MDYMKKAAMDCLGHPSYAPQKLVKIEVLEESIECAFQSMVDRKDFAEALDFISACHNKIPHYTVLRTIIFGIIMDNNCDKKVAIDAALYLSRLLTIYQPSDFNRRLYYKNALRNASNKSSDLWATFRHLVESSFDHHRIYRIFNDESEVKPVPHPHCDILVDFYVKVFYESFECLLTERVFYEKKEKSLVADLFWPSECSELSAAKENSRHFLGWINSIYIHSLRIQKVSVFKSLHQLLDLMVRCIIAADAYDISGCMPDSLICSSTCLLDIVKVIINTCKDIFVTRETMRRFLNNCSLRYLKIKICEYKLFELIFSRQPSERNMSPLTLKDIVIIYMFPTHSIKKRGRPPKHSQPAKQSQPVETAKLKVPKMVYKLNRRGDTELHNACRFDKPADLFELLNAIPAPDVNAKNYSGYTPLHVACISGTFLCAKVLIDECTIENSDKILDWTASDEEGFTALHIAIQKNICDITKMILKKGGYELLQYVDKNGRKPHHYAYGRDMEKVLAEFLPLLTASETDDTVPISVSVLNHTIPNLNNFKEYALYFHALHCLLSFYSNIFHLFDVMIVMKEDKSRIQIRQHEDKACCHFTPFVEHTICSVDVVYLKHLPDVLNHFIKCAIESTKEKELALDLELLPLQTYVAALKDNM